MEIKRIGFLPNVLARIRTDNAFAAFVFDSLDRYAAEDWGEISEDGKRLSDDMRWHGGKVFGGYIFPADQTKLWIITEANRYVTTVMFPGEYKRY